MIIKKLFLVVNDIRAGSINFIFMIPTLRKHEKYRNITKRQINK